MIDINFLARTCFYFDEPVKYKVENGVILISPVMLKLSEIFLYSADILSIDKNSFPDSKIIQMSYLQFVCNILLTDKDKGQINRQKLLNILVLCMGLKNPAIVWENEKKPLIYDKELNISITPKQFDDIRRIIMYQNIINYDDSYINPEIERAMAEVDELKTRNIEPVSIERKMAIISAHSGIPKKLQQEMTYRSHCLLFEEVCGETEFITKRPAAIVCGEGKNVEHWIFRKPKDKFEGYVKSVDSYTQSMGGKSSIQTNASSVSDKYIEDFNNFNK